MITEPTTKTKKKTTGNAEAKAAADGDHRKRRRNRTTQSCLNCHTSKRMCDRRRPACSRCTQLGLTGLCVYEVDDPNQRSDPQDESSRLLKRVAELEGVIRELKNKPHPRWVQPREDSTGEPKIVGSNEPLQLGASNEAGSSPIIATPPAGYFSRSSPTAQSPARYSPPINTPTLSSPSPGSTTPSSESSFLLNDPRVPPRLDLTALFSSYPSGPVSAYDSSYGSQSDLLYCESFSEKDGNARCNCLTETDNYNALLELSLRLRKAAQIMAQSRCHQMGSPCTLHRHIAELDLYTRQVYDSNRLTSLDTYSMSANAAAIPRQAQVGSYFDSRSTGEYGHKMAQNVNLTTVSPQTVSDSQQWDMLSINSHSYVRDDSFMSWEPTPHRA
ncbi:hypothetical protein L218DRAFT_940738 [Marasmius fiardii PR-910]|nr:hypothetical protein L218DRAFT_940738 [Marasmius fiardii PR-910]